MRARSASTEALRRITGSPYSRPSGGPPVGGRGRSRTNLITKGERRVLAPPRMVIGVLSVVIPRGEPGDASGLARQAKDVQPRVGAVDDVDQAAVVGRDVVRLDDLPADIGYSVERAAAEVGKLRDGRNEEADVFRIVRIADVDGA